MIKIEDKYREYYESNETNFGTSIHTRVNTKYRISTIYRRASTIEPMFFWETIIWEDDKIFDQEAHNDIEKVLEYHYNKYFELGGYGNRP